MDWRYLFTSFEGRIGRQSFWLGIVCLIVLGLVLSIIVGTIFGTGYLSGSSLVNSSPGEMMRVNSIMGWNGLLILAIMAYPSLAIMLKRRHDRGSAGRGVKAYFVVSAILLLLQALGIGYSVENFGGLAVVMPNAMLGIIGVVVGLYGLFLLVVLGFLRGDEGSNVYGPDPTA